MRVLLKISWEALAWDKEYWLDPKFLESLSFEIKELVDNWISIWIVLWWWNFFRWVSGFEKWFERTSADYMWMLATVMNGLALQNTLNNAWCTTSLMSAFDVPEVCEKFSKRKAIKYLEKWNVLICVWWTWNPYFTTDTWWVLRALELECNIMIKATKVDWVYDKDPKANKDAILIEEASYDEVITKNLKVMDQTWIALARDWNLTIKVLNLYKKWNILKACLGEKIWTTIS